MRSIIRAFRRIPEANRTIAFGFMSLVKNLFYFVFKIIVGIVFNARLLIVIAIYNLVIGLIKANCSRGLWKNKDDKKDCQTYIFGSIILLLTTICYMVYTTNMVYNPSGIVYSKIIAITIALFSTYSIVVSLFGLFRTKSRTMLVQEYKVANFASALTNIVLTQVAILSFMQVPNMNLYNSFISIVVGVMILIIAIYLLINGLIKLKVYTTGITNKRQFRK